MFCFNLFFFLLSLIIFCKRFVFLVSSIHHYGTRSNRSIDETSRDGGKHYFVNFAMFVLNYFRFNAQSRCVSTKIIFWNRAYSYETQPCRNTHKFTTRTYICIFGWEWFSFSSFSCMCVRVDFFKTKNLVYIRYVFFILILINLDIYMYVYIQVYSIHVRTTFIIIITYYLWLSMRENQYSSVFPGFSKTHTIFSKTKHTHRFFLRILIYLMYWLLHAIVNKVYTIFVTYFHIIILYSCFWLLNICTWRIIYYSYN